jgi:hypothetical protein
MENIKSFLNLCRDVKVPEADLFSTPDLHDGKDLVQVLTCLLALARTLSSTDWWEGPKLGPKVAKVNIREGDFAGADATAVSMLLKGSSEVMTPVR